MEVEGAEHHKLTVCTYEMFGTAMLVFNILVSGGDAVAGSLTAFAIICVLAPVTGAHFNPAISIGVYVSRIDFRHDLGFFLIILVSQFVGAFLGMALSIAVLYSTSNTEGQWLVIPEFVPLLCPKGVEDGEVVIPCDLNGTRHVQAFLI